MGRYKNREIVYEIIDGERFYQEQLWGHADEHDAFHSVGDFIVYMDEYMKRVKEKYTVAEGEEAALDMMRKVVALGVACFEIHGVPERKLLG